MRGPRLVLLCLALTLLLSLPPLLHPVWGSIPGLLAAVPIGAAFIFGGPLAVLPVVLLASLAVGLAAGPLPAVYFLLDTGLMGALLGLVLRRGLPYPAAVTAVTGLVLALHLLVTLPPAAWLPFRGMISMQEEIQRAEGVMRAYLAEGVRSGAAPGAAEKIMDIAEAIFPGLFVLGAMLNTLFCAVILGRVAGDSLPPRQSFASWRLPDALTWLFIPAAFAVVWDYRLAWGIPASLLVVMAFLYTAQGLAVALALAERRRLPSWARLAAAVLVILQPFLLAGFLVVGLLDFRFDFRRPRPAPGQP